VQTNPIAELGIQDLILLENRDRHYAPDIYVIRGIYQMQDLDFNLSQFGIFLNNDTIFMHFHLRNCVDILERKIMAGDVLELPHLKDEYALDDAAVALKRFYVVQDVTRAASGFSQTWYPHLLRVKCVPMVDSQEFQEILDADSGAGDGSSLRDLISTYNTNISINESIIAQAEADAPLSGYDTQQLFVLPQKADGTLSLDSDANLNTPTKDYYLGYLTDDGRPPNGAPYTFGIGFPQGASEGHFHLRTDYFPNRLFRFNGQHWIKFEDNVRMTMTNTPADGLPAPNSQTRQTQRTSFINNSNTATIAGELVEERQALSKILKPKADN